MPIKNDCVTPLCREFVRKEIMKTKLKELRKINNLSMDKLGKEINMSSGEISDIENGKKKDPRISTLIKIADYFDVSLDELIGRKLND